MDDGAVKPRGPVLVLGAGGQVGRALLRLLEGRGIGWHREQGDLADPAGLTARLAAAFDDALPAAVINAAAYTAVDRAETETSAAHTINAVAPAAIAAWCARRRVPFVHYSTDYVYDGSGVRPWTEADPTAPINAYGRTKLAGDTGVRDAGGDHLIVRTSWVFAAAGHNFVRTMLRLAAARDELAVVADQHGAPTYADHLAAGTLAALERALAAATFPTGVYHLAGSGDTTWHGFAGAILAEAARRGIALKARTVRAITTAEYPVPAPRPRNSRLDTSLAERTFGVRLPSWHEALADYFDTTTESHARP